MHDWMRKYGSDIFRYGTQKDPVEFGGSMHSNYTFPNTWVKYTTNQGWRIDVNFFDNEPNFPPPKGETIDMDGIPIEWQVRGSFFPGITPLGIVKDIQIHW